MQSRTILQKIIFFCLDIKPLLLSSLLKAILRILKYETASWSKVLDWGHSLHFKMFSYSNKNKYASNKNFWGKPVSYKWWTIKYYSLKLKKNCVILKYSNIQFYIDFLISIYQMFDKFTDIWKSKIIEKNCYKKVQLY